MKIESTKQLRAPFGSAFKRYSAEHTAMRRMSADGPDHDRTVWIRGLSACLRLLLYAERAIIRLCGSNIPNACWVPL